jgi:hypothetical protein
MKQSLIYATIGMILLLPFSGIVNFGQVFGQNTTTTLAQPTTFGINDPTIPADLYTITTTDPQQVKDLFTTYTQSKLASNGGELVGQTSQVLSQNVNNDVDNLISTYNTLSGTEAPAGIVDPMDGANALSLCFGPFCINDIEDLWE